LRNNHTGEIISPAPIFDNGNGLFNYATYEELESKEKLNKYAKKRLPIYDGTTFENNV
jgi:hypothetical protein